MNEEQSKCRRKDESKSGERKEKVLVQQQKDERM